MLAKDEEEMAEAVEVEKERGVLPEDEEVKAEGGEVEKEERERHHCDECGKSYKYLHKLNHHKTWLCKEQAPRLVLVEPRREFSSNIFHQSEGDAAVASERVSKPYEQSEAQGAVDVASERVSKPHEQSEGGGSVASERVSKPNDQSEGSEAAGTFASERVSKPLVQGDGAVALLCFKCEETFTSKNSFKKHMKRKHKGEQVIRFSDILCISNVT